MSGKQYYGQPPQYGQAPPPNPYQQQQYPPQQYPPQQYPPQQYPPQQYPPQQHHSQQHLTTVSTETEHYCGPISCLIGWFIFPCIIFCPIDERPVGRTVTHYSS
eukprot:m.33818 g.33818  ORF g.33818 m.33818 type:complete len:104 (-) comp9881_c1_seq2:1392-1703(-)